MINVGLLNTLINFFWNAVHFANADVSWWQSLGWCSAGGWHHREIGSCSPLPGPSAWLKTGLVMDRKAHCTEESGALKLAKNLDVHYTICRLQHHVAWMTRGRWWKSEFTNKETEARKTRWCAQAHISRVWKTRDWNPRLLTQRGVLAFPATPRLLGKAVNNLLFTRGNCSWLGKNFLSNILVVFSDSSFAPFFSLAPECHSWW